jgi:hypothetical protein
VLNCDETGEANQEPNRVNWAYLQIALAGSTTGVWKKLNSMSITFYLNR